VSDTRRRRVGLTLKIFSATALVVAVVLGAALALSAAAARRTADESVGRRLANTAEVVRRFIDAELGKLASGAAAIAQATTFVAAIEAGDAGTQLDQAVTLRDILGADFTLITDEQAVLLARTDLPGVRGDTLGGPLIGGALGGEQVLGYLSQADERLFLAVATPLQAPPETGPIVAMLLAAHQVDDTLASEVQAATGSEVVFFVIQEGESGHQPYVVASSLRGASAADVASLDSAIARTLVDSAMALDTARVRTEARLGGETLVGFTRFLKTPGSDEPRGGYVVLRSLNAELAGFQRLQRTFLLAAIVALVLAVVGSFVVARRITRPVRALVGVTRKVAEGDYSAEVPVTSGDEIGQLASAFKQMTEELKAKQALVELLSAGASQVTQPIYTAAGGVASATMVQRMAGGPGSLEPGSVFAGRYEVKAVLGMGGMGVVYRAWDTELGEAVAIKTLKTDSMAGDSTALARFKDEIRLARKITHRNVVRTHDLGEVNGMYYITMEFAEGQSLKHLIQSRGKLPVNVVLTVGKQLCRALEAAHEQGVIHRDIKPQNLIVEPSGTLKVMDFGIARLAKRSEGVTQAGMAIGTPEYMSPEQLLGGEVDTRVDLYAAGAVLFECLCGRPPFVAETAVTLVAKLIEEAPPAPTSLNAEIPAALETVVLKALTKDPAKRHQSAVELHDELDAITV
jgi:serine/threonine-protein kinase